MLPNLKLQLWRKGIRQNRLASMLNIDETVLSKILNGFRQPSKELSTQIAHLLQCDEDWLFQQAPRETGKSLEASAVPDAPQN